LEVRSLCTVVKTVSTDGPGSGKVDANGAPNSALAVPPKLSVVPV
jgi:hypothetical protein